MGAYTLPVIKSLTEQTADVLRQAVLQGELLEGQGIKQGDWAANLGISTVTLREALRVLEAEGLVDILPNRGAFVSSLTPDEAEDIYDVRIGLELQALKRAIPCLDAGALAELDSILEKAENETDLLAWSAHNGEFHARLYRQAERPKLVALIDTTRRNIDRFIGLGMTDPAKRRRMEQEHWEIYRASAEGHIDQAMKLLEAHLERAKARLVTHLAAKAAGR